MPESFQDFDIRWQPLFPTTHLSSIRSNLNEMHLYSTFLDGIKAPFQRPLEKQIVSVLKPYCNGACVVENTEMSTWFMCHMISSTIASRTKEKMICSSFSTALYVALISSHSLWKWKKCVIFLKIHQAFITLFVLLCLLLFPGVCFFFIWRGRGLLSWLFLFVIHNVQKLEHGLFPHQMFE